MYTWIIYDIRKNKVRTKVAKLCQQIGLQRVQKSVFLGKTRSSLLKAFRKQAKVILNRRTDVLFIVPMTKSEYKRMNQIGNGFDKKSLSQTKVVHFV